MVVNKTDIIETSRLLLRRFRITDFDDYWNYISKAKIDPTYGWAVSRNKQMAMESLKNDIRKSTTFAIVYKKQNRVIGLIDLKRYKKDKLLNMKVARGSREINYILHENYWAQGIMPEALKAILEYAFITMEIPEIVFRHAEANIPSGEVQEALGLKIVDRTKNFCIWADGQPTACIYRKMTKDEYMQSYIRTSRLQLK